MSVSMNQKQQWHCASPLHACFPPTVEYPSVGGLLIGLARVVRSGEDPPWGRSFLRVFIPGVSKCHNLGEHAVGAVSVTSEVSKSPNADPIKVL